MKHYIDRIWNSATQRVMSVTTMGMALALLADMLLAAKLGTSVGTDVIIVALTLPRLLEVVIREGTRHSMIALYMEVLTGRPLPEYRKFTGGMFNLMLVVGIAGVSLCLVLALPIVSITGPGLAPDAKLHAAKLFRLAMPLVLLVLLQTSLTVPLNCERHFSVAALRNSAISGVVVLIMLLQWQNPAFPEWVAIAYTAGNAVFFLVVLAYSARHIGFRLRLSAWPDRNLNRKLFRSIAYPTAGFTLRQSARMVERMLASLAGPGAVSSYYFAYRLYSAAQSIIGVSAVTTAGPSLAEYGVTGRKAILQRFLRRRLKRTVLLSVPITLFVVLFSDFIVRIIYGRGQFDAAAIESSSQLLSILFLGFAFACIVPLLFSTVYGLKELRSAFLFVMQAAIVHIVSASVLFYLAGLPGLALAASIPPVYNSFGISRYLHTRQGIHLPPWKGSPELPAQPSGDGVAASDQ